MDRVDIQHQVEVLARELTALMLRRPHHHLTSLHVSCPAEIRAQDLKRLVSRRLAECGIDFVDVYMVEEGGPVRMVAAYVEPGPGQREVELVLPEEPTP